MPRWGRRRIPVMLAETDLEGGQEVAERIRKRIENTVFKYKHKDAVTMTFGLATKDDNIEDCIKCDSALYEGKNQGRNRVIVT